MAFLVINMLTREEVKKTRDEIFRGEGTIVHGSITNTYGLLFPFSFWIESPLVAEFLWSGKVDPSDYLYYEFWNDGYDIIPLQELYPKAGFWDLGNGISYCPRNRSLYRNNKKLISSDFFMTNVKLIGIRGMNESLNKLWRRGFLGS